MSRAAVVLLAALAVLLAPSGARGAPARWHAPLPAGRVTGPFTFDRRAPFARGARRNLRLAAAPGSPVLAVCAGRVAFVGPLPGGGRGVTLACGRLRATELGLAALRIRAGDAVRPGAVLGRLDGSGRLRLGARRAGVRDGYVDPAPLLAGPRTAPPAPAVPTGRPPAPAVQRQRRPPVTPPPAPGVPAVAWVGVGVLAAAVAGGATTTRRRRRAARPRAAAAHRYR